MDIAQKLNEILTDYTGKPTQVNDSTTFDSMGFDSLDKVELLMKIEEEFNVNFEDDFVAETVTELIEKIKKLKR